MQSGEKESGAESPAAPGSLGGSGVKRGLGSSDVEGGRTEKGGGGSGEDGGSSRDEDNGGNGTGDSGASSATSSGAGDSASSSGAGSSGGTGPCVCGSGQTLAYPVNITCGSVMLLGIGLACSGPAQGFKDNGPPCGQAGTLTTCSAPILNLNAACVEGTGSTGIQNCQ